MADEGRIDVVIVSKDRCEMCAVDRGHDLIIDTSKDTTLYLCEDHVKLIEEEEDEES